MTGSQPVVFTVSPIAPARIILLIFHPSRKKKAKKVEESALPR